MDFNAVFQDRFDAIERRISLVLNQLDEDQVNWRPNASSNSISNLIIHLYGYVNERIGMGINNKPFSRDRDQEFEAQFTTMPELLEAVNTLFEELRSALSNGNREQTNLEIYIQCAAHLSEHMGQMLYIAKIIKDEKYVTTSVPKKKPND
ncbi:DUF1572 domain-containing protein [Paenibacillus glycanilyticus]|uniref:DUF1572 family protein n=1 Tax=Paenibacillus glycanilyticus TaxID=126569 RepID=UPI0020421CCF|nr:DUF1572 family protein [Paenibacillus glycanilyticus]MCM3629888.1 DUF1572 domain-containing protein [Paenibacillus glycanilyticus]